MKYAHGWIQVSPQMFEWIRKQHAQSARQDALLAGTATPDPEWAAHDEWFRRVWMDAPEGDAVK